MKRFFSIVFAILLPMAVVAQGNRYSPERFVDVKKGSVALTHATLIDGKGGPVMRDMTIILDNDLIHSVVPSVEAEIPAGATIIDCTGRTIIPGLVMLHEHLFYSKPFENFFSVGQSTFTFPRMYLAGGVTTIRTAAGIQTQTDINIRNWIDEGLIAGPSIDVTGPFIDRPGRMIPELTFINDPKQAGAMVNLWADLGATSFKVYMSAQKNDIAETVKAAHERGFKVTGHLCAVTYAEAAELGIDNLEHGFMASSDFIPNKEADKCDSRAMRNALMELEVNSPAINDLISDLVRHGVALTSTLPVFEPYTGSEVVLGGGIDALAPQIRKKVEERYSRSVNNDQSSREMFKKEMTWEKRFHDAGGLLLAGTDPTGAGRVIPGYANWRELELLVEAGLSPVEAIKVATYNGAIYLNRDREIGTIEKGKKADLVITRGDLTKRISDIRNIELVFKNGVGYNSLRMFKSVKGQVGIY